MQLDEFGKGDVSDLHIEFFPKDHHRYHYERAFWEIECLIDAWPKNETSLTYLYHMCPFCRSTRHFVMATGLQLGES